MALKILHATPGFGGPMNESELKNFLSSKLNVQLATTDSDGHPVIHPVWYHYDSASNTMYIETPKGSQKVQNITSAGNDSTVYFSIDDETFPYKGARGKAKARISEDVAKNVPITEKIMIKYVGSTEHPMARQLIDGVKKGRSILIEIAPKYFSTWDFGKQPVSQPDRLAMAK